MAFLTSLPNQCVVSSLFSTWQAQPCLLDFSLEQIRHQWRANGSCWFSSYSSYKFPVPSAPLGPRLLSVQSLSPPCLEALWNSSHTSLEEKSTMSRHLTLRLAAQTMKAQRITNWTRPLEPTLAMTHHPFLAQLLSFHFTGWTDSSLVYSWFVDYNTPVFPFCLSELHFLIPTFPGLLLLSRLYKDHGEQLCEFMFRFS